MALLESAASTQDLARRSFAHVERPVAAIAHHQRAGRGRSGSTWETAPRAVAMSVAFRPSALQRSVVPLVAGVVARRVLGDRVTLKWPNDVMVGEDKVGGILVEAHDAPGSGVIVAGMGLNLHWPSPPAGAAGLLDADPGPDLGPRLGRRWVEGLLSADGPGEWPRGEYAAVCTTLGRSISWDPDGEGTAVDVAEDGALIVVDRDGVERHLRSGAVRHVRLR